MWHLASSLCGNFNLYLGHFVNLNVIENSIWVLWNYYAWIDESECNFTTILQKKSNNMIMHG